MSLAYHQRELAIALDTSDSRHALPVINPQYKRILDLGCGMGQSLFALGLPPNVEAYGIDLDQEALVAGQKIVPSNIHLIAGDGCAIPFPADFFDFVFARVAIPFMDINATLKEISRVLQPGGEVWMLLHPASMILARLRKSLWSARFADCLYCMYLFGNGITFHLTGKQMSLRNRWESFQTRSGMSRALRRSGLEPKPQSDSTQFIVEGRKYR